MAKPSFFEGIQSPSDLADRLSLGTDLVTDPLIERLGGPFQNQFGLSLFVGRELTKSYLDALKFGSEFDSIANSFKAAFQGGELQQAAFNFFSKGTILSPETPNLLRAGQGLLTEGLRGTALFGTVMGAVRGVGSLGRLGSILADESGFLRIGKNQTFSRFMSKAELDALRENKLLRGGRPGETFFTTNKFQTIENAKPKLSLKDPPEYRVDFRIKNQPSVTGPRRVQPNFGESGGGVEIFSKDPVEIEIIRIRRLRRGAR